MNRVVEQFGSALDGENRRTSPTACNELNQGDLHLLDLKRKHLHGDNRVEQNIGTCDRQNGFCDDVAGLLR